MKRADHFVRRLLGVTVYALLVAVGLALSTVLFVIMPFLEQSRCTEDVRLYFIGIGAAMAVPALFAYMMVPLVLDRFDPEPWWALLLALVWGGGAAAGISGAVNSVVGAASYSVLGATGQQLMSSVVSAPLVEEFWKGLFIIGMLYFVRSEFDGVVDGVIYATFVALGFAAVENVVYYSRSAYEAFSVAGCDISKASEAMSAVFVMRGIVSPWIHPLFTSMIGVGVGIARETTRGYLRWLAPIGGYVVAVLLHGIWNGSALLASLLSTAGLMVLTILLYTIFVFAFLIVVVVLVVREERIVRTYLRDEVLIGFLTRKEYDMVCSPIARLRGLLAAGLSGRRFVIATSKLAFKKWHVTRAAKGRSHTISYDFIEPLRQEITALRIKSRMHR